MSLTAVLLIATSALIIGWAAHVVEEFLPDAWSPIVAHMGVACGALVLVAGAGLEGART